MKSREKEDLRPNYTRGRQQPRARNGGHSYNRTTVNATNKGISGKDCSAQQLCLTMPLLHAQSPI